MHALDGTRSRAKRAKQEAVTPVADADIAPELLTPPSWLHRYAKLHWKKHALTLARGGRLKVHYLGEWTALCARWGLFERVTREIESSKHVTTKRFRDLCGIQQKALHQVQTLCLRFGLNPATDLRLSALDGSDVSAGAPAAKSPAGDAGEADRGDAWLKRHGASA